MSAHPHALRVVIADDHSPTRDDMRRTLEADGRFEVCATVRDAPGAVAAAAREQPDLCLLNIEIPGNGLAAAWEITARLPQVKIVMLAMSNEEAGLFAALRAGADGYLPKKTMNLARLPDVLRGVVSGEAAVPRTMVARMIEYFRGHEPRWRRSITPAPPAKRLTSREWEVVELLALGRSTAEIAEVLTLSRSSVRVHIAAAVRKLGVADRAALVELFSRRPGV